MNGQFYTLRWKGSAFGTDEHLSASENVVRIGQREGSDVLLPNHSRYADEQFAVIKPTKSADGWQIIATSEFVKTYVNGNPVSLNHYLKSGDHISFSESAVEILFEIKKGENVGTSRFTTVSRRRIALIACATAFAIALAVYGIIAPDIIRDRNAAALNAAEESVAELSVDSIYYIRNVSGKQDTVCRSGASIIGTAFLTEQGLLVTARHCIEPWLEYHNIDSVVINRFPLWTAWAVDAETYNRAHRNDTSYRVVSKCSIRTANKYWGQFWSSDFSYNGTRDEIVTGGDYLHSYCMRTITGMFNRSEMMLGDIAVMPFKPHVGTIVIPSESVLKRIVTTGSSLTFKGYPSLQEWGIDTKEGKVRKEYRSGHMISHDGELIYGYSGGPALIVYKRKAYVVGIVSTLDKGENDCIYSVPISEIHNISMQ